MLFFNSTFKIRGDLYCYAIGIVTLTIVVPGGVKFLHYNFCCDKQNSLLQQLQVSGGKFSKQFCFVFFH